MVTLSRKPYISIQEPAATTNTPGCRRTLHLFLFLSHSSLHSSLTAHTCSFLRPRIFRSFFCAVSYLVLALFLASFSHSYSHPHFSTPHIHTHLLARSLFLFSPHSPHWHFTPYSIVSSLPLHANNHLPPTTLRSGPHHAPTVCTLEPTFAQLFLTQAARLLRQL